MVGISFELEGECYRSLGRGDFDGTAEEFDGNAEVVVGVGLGAGAGEEGVLDEGGV